MDNGQTSESFRQTMRRTGFRQLMHTEKVARVALQVSAGQKVTIQDLVDCETLLNIHQPGTVSQEKARKRIYERNHRLKNPQGTYLNKWDNLGIKSKKYCKILLPQKIINSQERSYSEKLNNEPKFKVIIKAMVDNTGKSSIFLMTADSAENSKTSLRFKPLQKNPKSQKNTKHILNTSSTLHDHEASIHLDRSIIALHDNTGSHQSHIKGSMINHIGMHDRSSAYHIGMSDTILDVQASDTMLGLNGNRMERERGRCRSVEVGTGRGVGGKAGKEGFNLPLLKSMLIGKLEPLNEINFKTSEYLKYVNENSPLMRKRFQQVLNTRKGAKSTDTSKERSLTLDRRPHGPVLKPKLLIPQRSKYRRPQRNLSLGEFEENTVILNDDIKKVESKVNEYEYFYGNSQCLYPILVPLKEKPDESQWYDPRMITFRKKSQKSNNSQGFWETE